MPALIRRGATLAELLVALVLGTLVASAALATLRAQLRLTGRTMSAHAADAAVGTAWHLLARDLMSAIPIADSAVGVVAVSDSTLDLWATRGVAVVCDSAGADAVVVVAPTASDARAADWPGAPRPGDRLTWLDAADLVRDSADAWRATDLRTLEGASTCPAPPGMPRAPGQRWRVGGVRPSPGALLRVQRRTEHRLYRSSDGAWALGLREWSGIAWSTTQPVVAPFVSGRDAAPGIVLVALDRNGPVASPLAPGSVLRGLHLAVRGADAGGRAIDSLALTLPVGWP
ncbi:MAG: hypothetical protein MUE41_17865 [Gemmatimonadaceae bacterium]|nr:hypothetical protein [Gemmatimonadaceae bacterium]